jgi:hypothetical protein
MRNLLKLAENTLDLFKIIQRTISFRFLGFVKSFKYWSKILEFAGVLQYEVQAAAFLPRLWQVRSSAHKVTGLQGLCALNTLGIENSANLPTLSPCNPSGYALNSH